jgi:DNA repair ATPase RecN
MGVDIVIVYKALGGFSVVIGVLCAGHIKWMTDLKKTVETRLQKLENRAEELRLTQVKHSSTFVTEPRTRDVIKEEISPLKEDIHELKNVVGEIRGVVMTVMEKVSALVTEVRIINAVQSTKD